MKEEQRLVMRLETCFDDGHGDGGPLSLFFFKLILGSCFEMMTTMGW
jgi:hypothetical protein